MKWFTNLCIILSILIKFPLTLFAINVVESFPVNEAKNVPVDVTIKVKFDKDLKPETINIFTVLLTDIRGRKIYGKINYNKLTKEIFFQPTVRLERDLEYQLILKSGIQSIEGEHLQEQKISFYTVRGIKPTSKLIKEMQPVPNSVNVDLNSEISVTFKKDILPESVNILTFSVADETGDIFGHVEYKPAERKAIFVPVAPFDKNKTYNVKISGEIKTVDGEKLGKDISYSFKTGNVAVLKPGIKESGFNIGSRKSGTIGEITSLKKGLIDIEKVIKGEKVFEDAIVIENAAQIKTLKSPLDTVIKINDELYIEVINAKGLVENKGSYIVYLDGKVSIPIAGTIKVAGLTINEFRTKLQKILKEYFVKPRVTVRIKSRAVTKETIGVYITGRVVYSGYMNVTKGTRLIQVLTKARLYSKSSLEPVYVVRAGKKYAIYLQSGYLSGAYNNNIELEDNDIVIVPENRVSESYVYLTGVASNELGRNGRIPYESGMTLVDLLTRTNALNKDPELFTDIKIIRKVNGKSKVIKLNLKDFIQKGDMSLNIPLYPSDIIHVTSKRKIDPYDFYYIFGRVGSKRILYEEGITLLDVIAQLTLPHSIRWVHIMRRDDTRSTGTKVLFIDLRDLLLKGDLTKDIAINRGDILYFSEVRYRNIFNRFGRWLNRSFFPTGSAILSFDNMINNLKNLKIFD